ncbi:MAG: EpsG family protein [Chryseobacterium jejuense]|uniref:EpsG family protein n=1 Tax=Chryseobacterium jejuense TaxID=445960 RepID=UPI003D0D124C
MLLISLAIILFPLAFLDKFVKKFNKKAIILIFSILFVFLGGFRWLTGTDWYAYYYGFIIADNYFTATQDKYSYEWGFGMLNYIINITSGSYTVFLVIFTFLKVFIRYRVFIDKNFIQYSLLIFFLFYCYEGGAILGTRQMLAGGFIFLSILSLINKKIWYFIILVVIATSIHRSAIIFILAYPVYRYSSSRALLLYTFLASSCVYFIFLNSNVTSLLSNLPIINNFDAYQKKIEGYSEAGQTTYGQIDTQTTMILGFLKKAFIVLPLILSFNMMKKQLNEQSFALYKGLINLIVFGSAIYFVFGGIASDFKRLNGFFDPFEILIIPIFVYNIKNKKFIPFWIVYFAIIAFSKLYSSVLMFEDLIDPFYFIFDMPFYRKMY